MMRTYPLEKLIRIDGRPKKQFVWGKQWTTSNNAEIESTRNETIVFQIKRPDRCIGQSVKVKHRIYC